MYQRVSQQQPQPEPFTVDFADLSAEDIRLYPHEQTLRAGSSTQDDTASSVSLATTDLVAQEPVKPTNHQPDDADVNVAPTTLDISQRWYSVVFDAVLSLFPLFFLVIAVLCLLLDGQPISPYGENIKAITLLSPTIFPVVYAAIFWKVLRRIGLFKAERSSTLGTLEQLMGSQSLFASVERQFALRHVNFLGIAIIATWFMSPLGGQASLRLLSTGFSQSPINTTVGYHAISSFPNYTKLGSSHLEEYYWTLYGPLFLGALQASTLNDNEPRDLFGNARIPDISSIGVDTDTIPLALDWHDTRDKSSLTYSSLLGNTVFGVPATGNVSFVVESSYWEVRCKPFFRNITLEYFEHTQTQSESDSESNVLAPGVSSKPSFNMTIKDASYNATAQYYFDYMSKAIGAEAIKTSCTASLRIVESEIGCDGGICDVRRMRNSERDVAPFFRPDSVYAKYWWYLRNLCLYMPGVDRGPSTNMIFSFGVIENWITDPQRWDWDFQAVVRAWKGLELMALPTKIFSQRLQVTINTFWGSTTGWQYRLANLTAANATNPLHTITNATGVRYDGEHYVCNTTFAALTIVISWLLFMTASISAVLGFVTKAPDILGYVSTLARDNPYFEKHVPSHLDGLQAARALRDVRVTIGDVHKKQDVGHVAFASVDAGPERVNIRRMYD